MTIDNKINGGSLPMQASSSAGVQSGTMDARQKAKLVDGARSFEGMMLQEMLKPLHFGSTDASDDSSSGGGGDTIRGFATEALSKALASKGGVGIAEKIVKQVSAAHDKRGLGKVGTKVW